MKTVKITCEVGGLKSSGTIAIGTEYTEKCVKNELRHTIENNYVYNKIMFDDEVVWSCVWDERVDLPNRNCFRHGWAEDFWKSHGLDGYRWNAPKEVLKGYRDLVEAEVDRLYKLWLTKCEVA